MAARNTPSTGSKSDKVWRDAIHRAVKRRVEGEGNPQALDRLADALVSAGLAGEVAALKEIGDRLDGKPAQAIVGGDEGDAPVRMEVVWSKPGA